MILSDILDNRYIIDSLRRTKNNDKIHHAQLFYGPPGNEKLKLALAFIKYINCKKTIDENSCQKCFSCKQISKLQHPDILNIFPIISNEKNKSVNDYLKTWRKFIIHNPYSNIKNWADEFDSKSKNFNISKNEHKTIHKFASIKAYQNKYKIIFTWLPEFMNISTSNALLKIIEAPPPNTIFVFVSEAIDLIPKTLISRFIIHYIPPISITKVEEYLKNKYDHIDDNFINEVAKCCGGNINKANEILTNSYNDQYVLFQSWMRSCYQNNLVNINNIAEDLIKENKERQKQFLIFAIEIIRNAFLKRLDLSFLTLPIENDIFLKKFSNQLSLIYFEQIYYYIEQTISGIERNANFKLAFMDLSIKIFKCFKTEV